MNINWSSYQGNRDSVGRPHGDGSVNVIKEGVVYQGGFDCGTLEGFGRITFAYESDVEWCGGTFTNNHLSVCILYINE